MLLRIGELKKMVNAIPVERDGEPACMWHPFYRRLFRIVAVDDLQTIDPAQESQIVVITEDREYNDRDKPSV